IIGSLSAYFFNGRFDNFLHFDLDKNPAIWKPFLDNLIILGCLFLFLLTAGKIINAKTRAIDILATGLIGNAPFYIMALSNINGMLAKSTDDLIPLLSHPELSVPVQSIIILSVIGIFGILIPIWVILLLYNGFKTAANAKSTKAVVLFIAALVATLITTLFIPTF